MCEIVRIVNKKGKIELNFKHLNEILRDELGVSLISFNDRIEFLLDRKEEFKIIEEYEVIDYLRFFIRDNFRKYCKDARITYDEFLDVFIREKPISKRKRLSKSILKREFELFEEQIVILRKLQSIEYLNNLNYKEMLSFLRKEDFHLEKDSFGNFCKGSDVYYKEIQKNKFLVFVDTQDKKVNQKHFDFYRVKGKSAKSFIEYKTSDFEFLTGRFELKEDIGLYKTEQQKPLEDEQ